MKPAKVNAKSFEGLREGFYTLDGFLYEFTGGACLMPAAGIEVPPVYSIRNISPVLVGTARGEPAVDAAWSAAYRKVMADWAARKASKGRP